MASEPLAGRSVAEAAGSSTDLQAAGAGLRSVEFPAGVWGYKRHAVDAYVARVCSFVDEALALRRPEGTVRDALARVGEETSAVLQRAAEVAEDITARSQTQADDRLARAERDAAAIREAAEAHARELDAEIEHLLRERARLIADVERIADELSAVAGAASPRHARPQTCDAEDAGEMDVPAQGVAGDEDPTAGERLASDDEAGGEEMIDDGLDDFLLGEDDADHEDHSVHHGEVPAAAELQITRVLPRVWRD